MHHPLSIWRGTKGNNVIMTTTHTLWLFSPLGERLALLDNFLSLTYRRVVNGSGLQRGLFGRVSYPFTLTLPDDRRLAQRITRDSRIEVWRATGSGLAELDTATVWFVRRIARRITSDGVRVLEIQAVPAIGLLERRLIAANAGSAAATRYGYADNIMKAIVCENLGTSASAARSISTWLAVQPDQSAGAVVRKAFAWRNVLTVLRELADASTQAGTPVFFDIIAHGQAGGATSLQFCTWAHVRGVDRRYRNAGGFAPVVVSYDMGNLVDAERATDWHDEATWVYVAGQGARDGRQVVEVGDTERATATPFGRIEVLQDARHITTADGLTSEGRARLQQHQPQNTFAGTVISREPSAVYGRHWRFGDIVSAEFDGEIIACRIDQVNVAVDRNGEHISATLAVVGSRPQAMEGLVANEASLGTETERTYQQVQEQSLPADEELIIPTGTVMTTFGDYAVNGELRIDGELRNYT
jgi:hypothetical protein